MKEKLLYKCNDIALAEYIADVLKTNGITSRKHDEKMTQHPGAYGPDEGIAIYVMEQDFDKATDIIDPIITENSHSPSAAFCPDCDSEEIEELPNPLHKYRTAFLLGGLVLILIPLIYFGWNIVFAPNDISSGYNLAGNILATVSMTLSIVLWFLSEKAKRKYRCKKCGKTFSRN